MKRIFKSLVCAGLIGCIIAGLTACGSDEGKTNGNTETGVNETTGEWNTDNTTAENLLEDVSTIFNEATADRKDLIAVAFLGQRMSTGYDYAFLCKNDDGEYKLVSCQDNENGTKIIQEESFELTYEGNEDFDVSVSELFTGNTSDKVSATVVQTSSSLEEIPDGLITEISETAEDSATGIDMLDGKWHVFAVEQATALHDDIQEMFDAATENSESYTPLAYLGSQTKASGTVYAVLCQTASEAGETANIILYISTSAIGNGTISGIRTIDLATLLP